MPRSDTKPTNYNKLATRPRKQASQGTAECALATVMGAHGQTTTEPLHSPHLPGQKASITVRAEQAKNSSDLVVFELGGTNCPRGHKRYVCVCVCFVLFCLFLTFAL